MFCCSISRIYSLGTWISVQNMINRPTVVEIFQFGPRLRGYKLQTGCLLCHHSQAVLFGNKSHPVSIGNHDVWVSRINAMSASSLCTSSLIPSLSFCPVFTVFQQKLDEYWHIFSLHFLHERMNSETNVFSNLEQDCKYKCSTYSKVALTPNKFHQLTFKYFPHDFGIF